VETISKEKKMRDYTVGFLEEVEKKKVAKLKEVG
jgi:hypothetical protein